MSTVMNQSKHKFKKFQFKPKVKAVTFGDGIPPSRKRKHSDTINETTKFNNNNNSKVLSMQEHRRKLPIFQHRNKLIELIKQHDTIILLGETGSGKTTQVPQFIHSGGVENVAITQPRRVAAISVATRVAQEMGLTLGETVGYTVRFEDVTCRGTRIKYLTDGMLLREAIADRLLMSYTVVILDEAHERTINTDVLFGIVKKAQRIRKEKKLKALKVLLMSATMDVDHFSKYFNNCRVVYLEGRTYPVNILHTKVPQDDYQSACVSTFFKIHREAPANHDVLIFLTGQEEIDVVAHQIRVLAKDSSIEGPHIKVLTLYAAQSIAYQMTVFQPTPENTRKVIISTNIAETSITISGIKYIIDSGMVKARTFHPATGLDLLKIQRISQEQAWQRAGRAGRESEGYCYRIYTKNQFTLLTKSTKPEIQRANLASVALQLLAMGVHALHFDFMDKPPKEAIVAAFELLKQLGSIESIDKGNLTPLGKKMAQFPLDPRFSKIILSSPNFGCSEEIITIIALLSGESLYLNPPSRREEVQIARQKFYSGYGDHITLLNVYRDFSNVSTNNTKTWCARHFINGRNILYAKEVRLQLIEICKRLELPMSSCGSNIDQIRKCLLTGLFTNVAELHKDKKYITLDKRQTVLIHPSSVLYGQLPPYVLFTEVVHTSKCYLRSLTSIEVDWFFELVPEYARSHKIKNKD